MNNLIGFNGVVIPMVTPLREEFKIDHSAVELIINRFISAKTFPFILGTTGEASLIPNKTKLEFVKYTGKQFNGKTCLYAGITMSNLEDTITNGKVYADLGADVVVATLPNGYPLGIDEQYSYYEKLADNIPVPLVLYNIPQTTHISVDLTIIDKLSYHPNIVGLKDSERNNQRQKWALNQWKDRNDFVYFSGSAVASASSLLNGGSGIVPSSGNLVPGLYQELYLAAKDGDEDKAYHLQEITDDITNIYAQGKMLYGSLPSLKGMMRILGLCQCTVIPPFQKVNDEELERLRNSIINNPNLNSLLNL